ncbi:MAG: TlyA family RNA methyltransferase [Kofleriaceae bacterium]|nr:TlyA family RNA methyltransferase [Kofleriaceae bacterium]
MARRRLDKLLVKKALASTIEEARELILGRRVMVAGIFNEKPASQIDGGVDIKLVVDEERYVSRGAHKLVQGLSSFNIDPRGMVALDIGASTGGFSDVLLKRGARKVFAIDVGYGQLAWSLRQDDRVVVLERENVRTIDSALISESADIAVIDVSFISLTKILDDVWRLMDCDAGKSIVALVKPQFEARKEQVGKGGVVRDLDVRQECIDKVARYSEGIGLGVGEVVESPIRGPAGNVEFLIELTTGERRSFDTED